MDFISIFISLVGLAVSVWAVLKARSAKKAADAANRLVARQRLASSFSRMEHASQMVHLARLSNLAPLFTVVAFEWRPIAAEVRALVTSLGRPRRSLLTALTEVNTLMDMAREDMMNNDSIAVAEVTTDVARSMMTLVDLVTESRIALEHQTEES